MPTQFEFDTYDKVLNNFTYVEDEKKHNLLEHWTYHRKLPFQGDCDDFALTLLFYLSNQSLRKMLKNLITRRYIIVFCFVEIVEEGDFYGMNHGHIILKSNETFADARKCNNNFNSFVSQQLLEKNRYHTFIQLSTITVLFEIYVSFIYGLFSDKMKSNKVLQHFQWKLIRFAWHLNIQIFTNPLKYWHDYTSVINCLNTKLSRKAQYLLVPFELIWNIIHFVVFLPILILLSPFAIRKFFV